MLESAITSGIHRLEITEGKIALKKLDKVSKIAVQYQKDLLQKIMQDNKDTEYGRLNHFADVKNIDDYRRLVPYSNYDTYAPLIERVIDKGEKNLYTVYPIRTYALSSGSVGVPKRVPVSDKALKIYSEMAGSRAFAVASKYYKQKTGKNYPFKRGFNTLEVTNKKTKDGLTLSGCISGATLESFESLLKYAFTSPNELIFPKEITNSKYLKALFALADRDCCYMLSCFMTGLVDEMNLIKTNWESLCDDIEKGEISKDIDLSDELRASLQKNFKADPERAQELREEFKKGFDTPIVPRIWKNMSFISTVGTSGFMAYTDKMREFSGSIPIDFLAYAASEGLMGVAYNLEEQEYVLLPMSGFYEFIPENAEDESITYTIEQLEVGKKYEVVLTNLSGFYRYRLKDVIEVTGWFNETPKVRFSYRKSQLINISGEKITEGDLAWAIKEFAKDTGIVVNDYCVYADTDTPPGRYVVLIEPDKPVDLSKLDEYSKIMDEKLGLANEGGYKYERDDDCLGPAIVLIQQQQTHALYRDVMLFKGRNPNQLKLVRVLDTPMKEKFFLGMVEK